MTPFFISADRSQAPPLHLQFCLTSGKADMTTRGLAPLDLALSSNHENPGPHADRNPYSSPALTIKGKLVSFPCPHTVTFVEPSFGL